MMSSRKSRDLDFYFGIFLKEFLYYHIHEKFHSQVLTRSGFLKGDRNDLGLLMSKMSKLLRLKYSLFLDVSSYFFIGFYSLVDIEKSFPV